MCIEIYKDISMKICKYMGIQAERFFCENKE